MASRPRVSDVVNKKTSKFTIDTLVEMLSRVGKPVKLALGRFPDYQAGHASSARTRKGAQRRKERRGEGVYAQEHRRKES